MGMVPSSSDRSRACHPALTWPARCAARGPGRNRPQRTSATAAREPSRWSRFPGTLCRGLQPGRAAHQSRPPPEAPAPVGLPCQNPERTHLLRHSSTSLVLFCLLTATVYHRVQAFRWCVRTAGAHALEPAMFAVVMGRSSCARGAEVFGTGAGWPLASRVAAQVGYHHCWSGASTNPFHRVSTRRAASRCMDRSTQLSWTQHPMGWPKTMRVNLLTRSDGGQGAF